VSPWALPKPCGHPGCPNTTPCPLHGRPRQWAPDKRKNAGQRGYGNDWAQARKVALKRFDFICQRCGRRAVMVHHMDKDPQNNDQSNLMPLCRACHEASHGRKK